jgi:MFS family permease
VLRGSVPYLLILPVVAVITAILGYPLYRLVTLSFQQYGLAELIQRKGVWIGLDNFESVLGDEIFWRTLLRTVIFTAATVGLLVSSLLAERLAKRRAQRTLIIAGFVVTMPGIAVLTAMVAGSPSAWAFAPGLFLIGFGIGAMLTPSVNVVQSSVPEGLQGEISGLSRSVSNLGSCLGTAIAGTILVASLVDRNYGAAMITLGVFGLLGLGAAWFLPAKPAPQGGGETVSRQPIRRA